MRKKFREVLQRDPEPSKDERTKDVMLKKIKLKEIRDLVKKITGIETTMGSEAVLISTIEKYKPNLPIEQQEPEIRDFFKEQINQIRRAQKEKFEKEKEAPTEKEQQLLTSPKQMIQEEKRARIVTLQDINKPSPPPKPSYLKSNQPTITLSPQPVTPLSSLSNPILLKQKEEKQKQKQKELELKARLDPFEPEQEEILRKQFEEEGIEVSSELFEKKPYKTSAIKKRKEKIQEERLPSEAIQTERQFYQTPWKEKLTEEQKEGLKMFEKAKPIYLQDDILEIVNNKQEEILHNRPENFELIEKQNILDKRKNFENFIKDQSVNEEERRKLSSQQSHELKKIGLEKGIELGGELLKGGLDIGKTALQNYYSIEQQKEKSKQDKELLQLQQELLLKAKEFDYQLQQKYLSTDIERQKLLSDIDVQKQTKMKDIDIDKGKSITEFDIQKIKAQQEGMKEIKQIEKEMEIQKAQKQADIELQKAQANQSNTQQYIGLLQDLIRSGGQIGSSYFNRGGATLGNNPMATGSPAIYITNKNISGAGRGTTTTTTRTTTAPRTSKLKKNISKEAIQKAKQNIKLKSNR